MNIIFSLSCAANISFIKTPWATACLVFNGFMYNCHSIRGNRGYWRCHNYSKKQADQRCRARCVLLDGILKSVTGGLHNHPPHTDKIEKILKRSDKNYKQKSRSKLDYHKDYSAEEILIDCVELDKTDILDKSIEDD